MREARAPSTGARQRSLRGGGKGWGGRLHAQIVAPLGLQKFPETFCRQIERQPLAWRDGRLWRRWTAELVRRQFVTPGAHRPTNTQPGRQHYVKNAIVGFLSALLLRLPSGFPTNPRLARASMGKLGNKTRLSYLFTRDVF